MPQISIDVKNKVKLILDNIDDAELLKFIKKIDHDYSLKINIADKLRISKLLEVYFETKKKYNFFPFKE